MTSTCTPTAGDFVALAREGTLVPVYREILADTETPVSAYLKVARGSHGFLLESVQGVPGARYDQEVTGAAFPGRLAGGQPDPAAQHLNGGLARAFVLGQRGARGQGEHRLAQRVLMAAVHGLGAAACRGGGSPSGLLADDGVQ